MSRFRTYRPRVECLESRLVPATFTVKNLNDAGTGSLRQAILDANGHDGADVVVFQPGLVGTIGLSGEISITADLTLNGPGAAKITVDGNQFDRIFRIFDSQPSRANVTIRGLTLFNGVNPIGGAISNAENLTLAHTVITGNAASFAGGIFSNGALTIRASTISGNSASLSFGGAIYSVQGDVLLDRCTISGNTAATNGGGVIASAGTLTIRRSTVTGNSATTNGGGIYAKNGVTDLTIEDSTLSGNHAESYGGGIFTMTTDKTRITRTTMTANTANFDGGGVFAGSGVDQLTIEDCTVAGNRTGSHGAGLASRATDTRITRTTIAGNTANFNGGGVFADTGVDQLTIQNSRITNNRANSSNAGGVATFASNTRISRTTISFNVARESGGGLRSTGATVIDRSLITNNICSFSDGGGICQDGGTLEVRSSTIRGNHANRGGGISLKLTGSSSIVNSTISGNTAVKGGGLYAKLCALTILQNSTLSGNRAATYGGGLYGDVSDLTLNNCTVAFNRAGLLGGGISSRLGTIPLNSTIVAQNTAPGRPDLDSGTTLYSAFHSLIGSIAGAALIDSDQFSIDLFGADPRLAPLAFNGGPTQTHALKKGSPAINQGSNPANLRTDQRGTGFKRKVSGSVDIGAFERQ